MAILKKNLIIYVIIGVVIAGVISFSFLFPSQPQKEPEAPIIILGERNLFEEALTLFNDKKYQEAIEKYREFLNKYPDSLRADDALLLIGRSQRSLGNDDEALLTFQKLMTDYPNSDDVPNAFFHSAQIYKEQGKYEKAYLFTDKILKEYPDAQSWIIENSKEFIAALPQVYGPQLLLEEVKTLYQQAQALDFSIKEYNQEEYQEILEKLEKYQELANQQPQSNLSDDILFQISLCYMKLKKNDQALLIFEKLRDNYPNSIYLPSALYYSAEIYFVKEDFLKANQYCDRILKEYPDTREWIINGAKKLLEELNK